MKRLRSVCRLRCDDSINANSILKESWGCGEVKNVVPLSVETTYKLQRFTKPIVPILRGIAPPMEILVNNRLKSARCDDSTNAKSILAKRWGRGEVKNVTLQWVQTAYKLLRATKSILPIHRGIAPPMVILVNYRLKSARCDDSTNANSIFEESWGCGDFKNVVLLSVGTTYKLPRLTKPIVPILRGIAPPMEILGNYRLKAARHDDSINANSILAESWGCGEAINVVLQLLQNTYKLILATKPILPNHHGIEPLLKILVNHRLKSAKSDDSTNANNIIRWKLRVWRG